MENKFNNVKKVEKGLNKLIKKPHLKEIERYISSINFVVYALFVTNYITKDKYDFSVQLENGIEIKYYNYSKEDNMIYYSMLAGNKNLLNGTIQDIISDDPIISNNIIYSDRQSVEELICVSNKLIILLYLLDI